MIQDKTRLRPLGTIVQLEGEDDLYVISGYFRLLTDGRIMDYSGVLFPDGDTGPGSYILFNQEVIKNVVSDGFRDADYDLFAEHIGEVEQEVRTRFQEAVAQATEKKENQFTGLE